MTKEELLSDLTPETFIAWVESIPEDKWCINVQEDGQGRHCFHGFLSIMDYGIPGERWPGNGILSNFFVDTFASRLGSCTHIAFINNGDKSNCSTYGVPYYKKDTPKQRVLAFLRDEYARIKKLRIPKEELIES